MCICDTSLSSYKASESVVNAKTRNNNAEQKQNNYWKGRYSHTSNRLLTYISALLMRTQIIHTYQHVVVLCVRTFRPAVYFGRDENRKAGSYRYQ